ncbi:MULTISPECIES: hypothetical protein [unclassified Streptomyces]|uniref:hypothetical protein n=1 Tax=unclassified Streptomyces TaxID=2593676 RepID=UPI003D89CC95
MRSGTDLAHGTDEGWAKDEVGTGTHAAGAIAGADTGKDVIGIAVDAEIDVCKACRRTADPSERRSRSRRMQASRWKT